MTFGDASLRQAALMSRLVFVPDREMFFQVDTREGYSKTHVSDSNLRFFEKPVHTLLKDTRLRHVKRAEYFPGQHGFIVEGEGGIAFNTWRPGHLQPVEGDASIILEHFEFLFPIVEERTHVLNVLAHAVQKPELKIKHCLFLTGGQGTGKSFLTELLQELFGSHNVLSADNSLITSSFNAPLANVQALVLEEVGLEDKMEAYNSLKTLVTQEAIIVNEKHVRQYVATTPRLILAISNREVPIKIEAQDRRFIFLSSPVKPREQEYYRRLFGEGLKQASAFLDFLLKRDITAFSPDARPPMTEAKRRIIEASKPVVQRELEEMVRNREEPFDADLFTLRAVEEEILYRVKGSANRSTQEVARVLRLLGFSPASAAQVRVGTTRLRFWAEAGSEWVGAAAEELKEQWKRQGNLL